MGLQPVEELDSRLKLLGARVMDKVDYDEGKKLLLELFSVMAAEETK